ncbi:hypothetical protein TrLO_g3916 [Triparma laevis f. longispina]|uniref:Adenylate kinase active site lid domain-containing protein n=1 Tax=Triparma laevis f. longispina TaxID=1714387 RepID=A0A9W7FRB8_9STRA|nr:hypothetical protein TrLO_g3916 [Triparma laevis f. longispina]
MLSRTSLQIGRTTARCVSLQQRRSATYLILGKPGGGKGTISKKILKSFPSFLHLSTGDLLREEVNSGSELGKKAKDIMSTGALLPDQIILDLVQSTISKSGSPKNLLLDGFPRTLAQASSLDEMLKVDHVIALDVPDQTIIERTSDRWLSQSTNRVYSYSYDPPKVKGICDDTGEELIQREDDKPESVLKRLDTYRAETAPLNEYYGDRVEVFEGETSDVIFEQVEKFVKGVGE